jgi:hypothetical protein
MPVSARPGGGRTTVLALSMATVCMIAAACTGTRSDPSSSTASAVSRANLYGFDLQVLSDFQVLSD